MKAYLDDPQLKKDFVREIKWHKDQDMISQGTYGEGVGDNWRGCAVGCSIHSLNRMKGKKLSTSNHKVYETYLGMPEWLARLEDGIFEGLPKDKAMEWPLRFAKAVPVGVDLKAVKWKFCAYLLHENIDRVLNLDIPDELKTQVVNAIRGVLALHEEALKTGAESAAESAAWSAARSAAESAARSAWSAARSAWSAAWSAESAARSAWSAAESAAWSAAESAARSAARSAESAAWAAESAAWAATSSAWSAARSAAESAAESAARSAARSAESAAYEKHADKLIELLKTAPVAVENK
jgi:hypothetical protein